MTLDRARLLADRSSTGAPWCRAYSDLVDGWLAGVLAAAAGDRAGVALVAVGGYGRAELCPESDIDLMLVHDLPAGEVGAIADRVWYPIWDTGIHLGHSVCTVSEALALAADDLDTATALLSARLVAGDPSLADRLGADARALWQRRAKRWLTEVGATVEMRHEMAGEAAFLLEPDLKEGRGGLRDVHALGWAAAAGWELRADDVAGLAESYERLLGARVELQRRTGRSSSVLNLEDQDAVAAALGEPDADQLMLRLASAARRIAWTSDDTWRRIRLTLRGPLGRVTRRNRSLGNGLSMRDGQVRVDDAAPAVASLPLHAAGAAAREGTLIERDSLERLAVTTVVGDPWDEPTRAAFVDLLLTGRPAIRVIEALDQRGVWERFVPEWPAVRSRPQRNPYHRFTVDRHLLETAAHAAALATRVDRPDVLVIAALLHDMGKGFAGDHTTVGTTLAATIGARHGPRRR